MRYALVLILFVCGVLAVVSLPADSAEYELQPAVDQPARTAGFKLRDKYRHPAQTLEFFEVGPDMTVVEIWPGAGGWYTEILAPYLRDHGKLYSAHFDADSRSAYYRDSRRAFMEKLQAGPSVYDEVLVTAFNPPDHTAIAPAGSVDRVLTFRNVHNWYLQDGQNERVIRAFKAMFDALKPGGLMGVVDHRLPPDRPLSDQAGSGYMRQDYVIAMAGKAGFELLQTSEINANARDTADHPKGVWTLPPTLRLGDMNREDYLAIGESDRMTLKFRKPSG